MANIYKSETEEHILVSDRGGKRTLKDRMIIDAFYSMKKQNEELKKSNKNLESNYLSAVRGREDFRQSFKNKREEVKLLRKQKEGLKSNLRDHLIYFLNRVRDYEHESGESLAKDERESSEFVDIHLQDLERSNEK